MFVFIFIVTLNITLNSRHTASMLREITPNTYAKKFDSSIEAQQYIDELNFKRINIVGNAEDDEDKNDQDKNEKTPGVKRKLSDTIDDSVRLVIKEHIKKVCFKLKFVFVFIV